ncbi:MAG: SH3 domain-containing protein [Christensenellaceae bacterium]|nr:SH3 domain-containing protein [Christensenellaceae bacterium]
MKRFFALSVVLALVLMLCLGTASASSHSRYEYGSGYTAFVDASSLNLRAAPSTRAAKIGSLHRGTWVNILAEIGEWSYVETYLSGYLTRGYVYTGYLFVGAEYAPAKPAPAPKTVKKPVVVPIDECWLGNVYGGKVPPEETVWSRVLPQF